MRPKQVLFLLILWLLMMGMVGVMALVMRLVHWMMTMHIDWYSFSFGASVGILATILFIFFFIIDESK